MRQNQYSKSIKREFVKFMNINLHIQEGQRTSSKRNTKKITSRHIIVKLLKTKDSENLQSRQKEEKAHYLQGNNNKNDS